ncbi:hypothetical protein J2X24_001806 [Asticcacaulis solisilvae]|nr:hypothetical protein [Asticcacaulis solisilvae]MDR6800285.1 hypothetical protein [Asticcacaulis sp. BE141]
MGGYTEIVKAVFKTPPPPLDREFAPGSVAPVLARNAAGQNTLIEARWSLIPSTYRGKITDWKMTTAHARLEDVTERPAREPGLKNAGLSFPLPVIGNGRNVWEEVAFLNNAGALSRTAMSHWPWRAYGTMPKQPMARSCPLPY